MKIGITIIFIMALSVYGCASNFMEQYLNKDVREIVVDNGPPFNVFDMGDDRRVFQWRWGGGTFVTPQTTTVSGSTTTLGNSAWYTNTAITTGGNEVTSEGCILSYFATWNQQQEAWVVTDYRVPQQLVC